MSGVPKTVDPFGSETYGYTQQSTRCMTMVYSHVTDNSLSGRIDCSGDIIGCELSKTVKGGGQASFILVPRRNYLNLIFPNDYVNIYFDPGDGRGYIRTFFGFVDRIQRTINTDPNTGATTTRFQVQCSDFTKAFDKVNIYFNPHVAKRKDLINEWQGGGNIGGVELRCKGIAMHGSPADIVMNLSHLLFGLNSQYILPDSYPEFNLNESRAARRKWAKERLSQEVLSAIGQAEIQEFEDLILEEAKQLAQSEIKKLEKKKSKAWKGGLENFLPWAVADESTAIIAKYVPEALKNQGLREGTFQSQEWRAASEIASTTAPGAPRSLLDLIDFSNVEWESIDGYISAASICRSEGSLWSLMNSWSNEMLNELFCDLRPVPVDDMLSCDYDTSKDELQLNTGVKFKPCVVMREYPFGTIEGIVPPEDLLILEKKIGSLYIGALFSKDPGNPGRKTIEIPAMHPILLTKYQGARTTIKRLDVAVISVQDIIQEQIGRSDIDHVNLLEVYSDVSSGSIVNSRFLTQEVQPVVSSINIMRHGVRVRTYQTKFGRFSSEQKYAETSMGAVGPPSGEAVAFDEIKFKWPLASPVTVVSPGGKFGTDRSTTVPKHLHAGIDIGGGLQGTSVLTAHKGKVIKSYPQPKLGGPAIVDVDHGFDKRGHWTTRYLHLAVSPRIAVGNAEIPAGTKIGEIGPLGYGTTGSHLHFETRLNGLPIDPELCWGDSVPATTKNAKEVVKKSEDLKELVKSHGIDSLHNRRLLVRWALMLDHFYQHNLEYLSGTISTRAFPEIRVGYRLDIKERCESYYVEGVNHSWTYPNALLTTFTVSRGQRNNPYPVYVLPGSENFKGMRGKLSRLGQFFYVKDTSATSGAVGAEPAGEEGVGGRSLIDDPTAQWWGLESEFNSGKGYLIADSTAASDADKPLGELDIPIVPGDERGGRNV